jgi:hypothetical protein
MFGGPMLGHTSRAADYFEGSVISDPPMIEAAPIRHRLCPARAGPRSDRAPTVRPILRPLFEPLDAYRTVGATGTYALCDSAGDTIFVPTTDRWSSARKRSRNSSTFG